MMNKILALFILTTFSSVLAFAANNSFIEKQVVYTKTAPVPIGPYSQAVKTGDTIYISGQIPIDTKTNELVLGKFDKQAEQAIINLSEITKAAGGTLDDIIKVTVYMTDLANFTTLNQVMAKYFHKPYPARVVIAVKELPKRASIEIEAIMKMKKRD